MIRFHRLLPVLLLLFLPGLAHAQSNTPSLVGTWVSVIREVAHWSGTLTSESDTVATLVVEGQLGGVFRGTMTLQIDKSEPKYEGKEGLSRSLSETVLGVIDWDNVSVSWVDHEDETVYRARLVNENTMEVIVLEAGPHAVATRQIMIRQ